MADPHDMTTSETGAESTGHAQAGPAPLGDSEGDVTVPPVSDDGTGQPLVPAASAAGDTATPADADTTGAGGNGVSAPGGAGTASDSPYWLASAEAGAPTVHDASGDAIEPPPPGPRPTAAPNPMPGIRPVTPPQSPVLPDERHRPSIIPRIGAVLVMLVFAAALGYGLAFLSAQLVGQTGSSQPTVGSTASVATSVVPGSTSAGAVSGTARATAASSSRSVAGSPSVSPRTTPAASARFHVVARGETLTSIAARYGVSVGALAAANGITDPNTIYAGQRLVIPGP